MGIAVLRVPKLNANGFPKGARRKYESTANT
jgi:hypothetical protein